MVTRLSWSLVVITAVSLAAFGQGGNSIGGHVFGEGRTPLEGMIVSLMDDLSRSIARTTTDSSGKYVFTRLPSGKYRIRILATGRNYPEQENEVEIQNFSRSDSRGRTTISGFDTVQSDFYMRSELDASNGPPVTIFAQDVPENARKAYEEGVASLKQKNKSDAYSKLKNAIEAFPDYFFALETLGLEYVNEKHYDAATILLTRAVEINPKSYRSWYALAHMASIANNDTSALSASRKALELSPASVDALLLTGMLLRRTGSFSASQETLEKAKALAKIPVPDIHWQLALLYGNNMKRYKQAAEELEVFLKYLPKDADPSRVQKLIQTFRSKSK